MTSDEQREIYLKEIENSNNVKAVLNSKGWKETVAPLTDVLYKDIFQRAQASDNPNEVLKGVWMLAGIDRFLLFLSTIVADGDRAKEILQKADTVQKPKAE